MSAMEPRSCCDTSPLGDHTNNCPTTPPPCNCPCHDPVFGINVAHVAACCKPVEKERLRLEQEYFDGMGE